MVVDGGAIHAAGLVGSARFRHNPWTAKQAIARSSFAAGPHWCPPDPTGPKRTGSARMDMTGEYRIPAPREQVWAALNDPEILRQAIPGCDELIKHSDTELEAKVTAKVGPVKAKFGGNVRLENINPPVGYSIVGEGKGGAAGFAKGGADVSLAEDGDGTILTYSAKAEVGGKLAQIGSRLIQGTAKKMADEFFGKFSELVTAGQAPGAPAAAVGEPPAAAAAPVSEPVGATEAIKMPPPPTAASGPAPRPTPSTAPKPAAGGLLGGLGMPAYAGIAVVVLVLLYLIFGMGG
jgi:carbon monoxide dehydrogenase subunit G